MKVFVVEFLSIAGHVYQTLLVMRKAYGKDAITVRRWSETHGLSDVFSYHTENYSRAAELFLSTNDAAYERLLSVGEVVLK